MTQRLFRMPQLRIPHLFIAAMLALSGLTCQAQAPDKTDYPLGAGDAIRVQVFQNPDLLQKLNQLVHPRVMADTLSWVDQHRSSSYVIKEAALMRAAGDHNTLDKVVVVQAPIQLRIGRIRQRDPHRSEAEIQAIIDNQMSDGDRAKIADYVLVNDEAILLLPQIIALHRLFLEG